MLPLILESVRAEKVDLGLFLEFLHSIFEFSSAPNTTHRARGLDEIRFADVMTRFLAPNNRAQPRDEFIIGIAGTHLGLQVMLGDAEQAGANFAVDGQAQPVAMATKRFA